MLRDGVRGGDRVAVTLAERITCSCVNVSEIRTVRETETLLERLGNVGETVVDSVRETDKLPRERVCEGATSD